MEFPRFAVACGEEGSDPIVLHEGRTVRIDQFGMSGHLSLQDSDLADVAELGIKVWRYGMPWRLTEPSPGTYDWTLWDRALGACERHGLLPVIDLVHFGLPDHYDGFLDSRWIEGFRRYVAAFLDRYPEPTWFTPVNEPGITATFSARHGIWNDRRNSDEDYFRALANVTLANLEALSLIRSDRDGWWIGSEGFSCSLLTEGDDPGRVAATNARDMEWLVWDLQLGLDPRGAGRAALDVIDSSVLDRITALVGCVPSERIIAGHDIYPVSVAAYGSRTEREVTIEDRVSAYECTAAEWYQRYGTQFWISETSNLGLTVDDGSTWMKELMAAVNRLGSVGIPVRGVCWYSRGDQYDWDSALTVPVGNVTEVGLFDTARRPRPIARTVAEMARDHTV